MNRSRGASQNTVERSRRRVFVLLAYAAVVGGYYIARYSLLWTGGDTSRLTLAIGAIRDQAALQPTAGYVYPHGFCYQAVSLVFLLVAGLPAHTLQAVVGPLVGPIGLALTAFVFYAQVTKDRLTAALAVLLLLFQAEVLFVTLRGSHEKLGWPLMLVALTLLSRSTEAPLRAMALHVFLFYLITFAMSTTNIFFTSTFLVSLVVSLLLGVTIAALGHRRFSMPAEYRRLIYVSVSCIVIIFVSMAHIYPPALSNLRTLHSALDRVSALLLSFEAEGQPYEYISFGWVNPWVYLGLTVYTWLLIISSFVVWLWRGREILQSRQPLRLRDNLDWLFYAGFAFQVGISIVVDFAGVLSQNLQLRMFPGFTMLAAVMLARGIRQVLSSPRLQGRMRHLVATLAVLAATWFAVASVLKATCEPLLSNRWIFYAGSEDAIVRWGDRHLQFAQIWTGFDSRLRTVFYSRYANQSYNHNNVYNAYSTFSIKPTDRYVMFLERERIRGIRVGIAMPSVLDWNRLYDNGDAFLYHRRPRTPYQR